MALRSMRLVRATLCTATGLALLFGGTVVIGTNNSRSATGTITLLTSGGSGSAAAFVILGAPNATFSFTLPSSIILGRQGGTETMTVNTFVSNPVSTGTLDSGGSQTLKVGAKLTVSAGQAFGQYTGSFNVTVSYN